MWKFRRKPSWLSCGSGRTEIAELNSKQSHLGWKKLLPGLLVSAVALAAVFYVVDLNELLNALRLADYRFIALGAVLTFAWLVLRSFAWRTLLKEKASFGDVFSAISVGYLLNNTLPFRLGEVGRALLLGKKSGLSFWTILSTVVVERSLDLLIAAGLLLSTLPFVIGADWAKPAAVTGAVVVLAGLASLFLMARNQAWVLAVFEKVSTRLPFLKKLGGKALPSFLQGLDVLTDPIRFLRVVFWMLANWILGLVQYFVFLLAYFPEAKILWAAFALGAASVGVAAPSVPASVGVFELALAGPLSVAFRLDSSTAFAYAITLHVVQYVVVGVLGSAVLFREGETLTGLYQEVRAMLSRSPSG